MKTKSKKQFKSVSSPLTGLSENNYVLEGLKRDDFYISYNPDTGKSVFGGCVDDFLNLLQNSNDGGEETALCKGGEKDKFYILNGDFRKEYSKLVGRGFDACYKFYLSKKDEFGSSFTIE